MNKESLGYKVFRFTDHISIGRGGNNDIVLMGRDDVKVSRNHANVQKTKRRGVRRGGQEDFSFHLRSKRWGHSNHPKRVAATKYPSLE